jgi:hypothetical protein
MLPYCPISYGALDKDNREPEFASLQGSDIVGDEGIIFGLTSQRWRESITYDDAPVGSDWSLVIAMSTNHPCT